MKEYILGAIQDIGARRTAELLGISRTGVLSIAAGVATAGTLSLAERGMPRLQDSYRRNVTA